MNDQTTIQPDLLILDKGLDLQSPAVATPKGSVIDALNYEQVDVLGLSRVSGFASYDGRIGLLVDDYHVLQLSETVAAGQYLRARGLFYGIVVDVDGADVYVAPIRNRRRPRTGSTVSTDSEPSISVTASQAGRDHAADADAHYEKLLEINAFLRGGVGALPYVAVGLHWFRDRLYAVAQLPTLYLDHQSTEYKPLDDFSGGELGAGTVLYSELISGDYGDGSARVMLVLDSPDPGSIPDTRQPGDPAPKFANIYVCTNEDLSAEEGVSLGWRLVLHGWKVDFRDGSSPFGSLTGLNQNSAGQGAFSPTPIDDDTGRPTRLRQGLPISGISNTVRGWKQSTSPTSYSLAGADERVRNEDGDTVYAEAPLSWVSTSSQVTRLNPNTERNPETTITVLID